MMRFIRVEQHIAVWERSVYDVPVPDLSDEQAREYARNQVAEGAVAPWHVEVGDVVEDGPSRTSAVGLLGPVSSTAAGSGPAAYA